MTKFQQWLFNDPQYVGELTEESSRELDRVRLTAFVGLHLGLALIPLVGFSWPAVALAVGLYLVRMFLVTGVYHRYFSHRAYRLGRVTQFLFAVLGCTAGQRGPLWWAAHHRQHHIESDSDQDPHSPARQGRFYSHCLWFLTKGNFLTPPERIRDWLRFPELVWLERLDWLPLIALGAACYGFGWWMESAYPALGLTAGQALVWGFFVSTVVLYHATYTINSLAHGWGSRRFDTADDSRNNAWLALITLGEGWHNNHHFYPASARQGFYWWEIDITHGVLRALSWVGVVSDLRPVPAGVLEKGRKQAAEGARA